MLYRTNISACVRATQSSLDAAIACNTKAGSTWTPRGIVFLFQNFDTFYLSYRNGAMTNC